MNHKMPWKYGTIIKRRDRWGGSVKAMVIGRDAHLGVSPWWLVAPLGSEHWRKRALDSAKVWEIIDE